MKPLMLGLLFAVLGWSSPVQAVDLSVTARWEEPKMANDPTRLETQLAKTSIQYSLWACLDMPPNGVRVEERNTPRYCGYQSGVIVPASTPAGGTAMEASFTIPAAPDGVEKIELRIISFERTGGIARPDGYGYWSDIRVLELPVPPSGTMLWPPTYLGVK